jgi:hypothetical protein
MVKAQVLAQREASDRTRARSQDSTTLSQFPPAKRAPHQRSFRPTKAYAKALVDTVLRELDEAAGLKPRDMPPPPGEKIF